MDRREFLRTAGGAAGATAATGAASSGALASEAGGGEGGGGGKPDLGGYLDGVGNFDGVEDLTGKDTVTVEVGVEANGGAYGFGPAAIHVDNGATVVWEWTGEGGSHNVVSEDGAFESDLTGESGATFEHTFSKDGVFNYFCQPHKSLGMKGSVVVGEDFPTKSSGGSTPLEPSHMGADIHEHWVGVSVILAISVSLVFTFFVVKYGESAHTKGGNN